MSRHSWQLAIAFALVLPAAALFDRAASAQELLVGDARTNSILEYSISYSVSGPSATLIGSFSSPDLFVPYGMTIGPDGNLYVASLGNSKILEFNGTNFSYMGVFVDKGVGGLYYPNQIAFGPDNNLYVTSYSGNDVLKFEGPTSAHPGQSDGVFASAPGLLGPTGLAFGSTPLTPGTVSLFVNSSENGQVFQFNGTTGQQIGTKNADGSIAPYVSDPTHIKGGAGFSFFATDGDLYMTSFNPASANQTEQIVKYDTTKSSTSATFSSL